MYHPRCQIFGRSVVCGGILSCVSGLVVWCGSVSIFQSLKSVIIVSFGGISLSSGERAKFLCLHFLKSCFRPVWLLLSPGHILFVGRLQRCCISVRWSVLQSGLLSKTELMTSYSRIFITALHHFWYLALKMFNLSWVVWNVPGWPNGRAWDKMNLTISNEMTQLRRYPYCPIPLFTVSLFSRCLASIYFPLPLRLSRRFMRRRFLWRWITTKRRSSSVSEERCRRRWVWAASPCFQRPVFPLFPHYEDSVTSRQTLEMYHRNDKSLVLLTPSGYCDIEGSQRSRESSSVILAQVELTEHFEHVDHLKLLRNTNVGMLCTASWTLSSWFNLAPSFCCTWCSLFFFCFFFEKNCGICQDALTDLTGDSERLPVEEQHGTWLGHKVRADCFWSVLNPSPLISVQRCSAAEVWISQPSQGCHSRWNGTAVL